MIPLEGVFGKAGTTAHLCIFVRVSALMQRSKSYSTMQNSRIALVSALAGFAGGLTAGLLLSSPQGAEFRSAVQERVRRGVRHLDERVRQVEAQLHELERSIQQASENLANRVQRPGGEEEKDQTWEVTGGDVARELPRMPRGGASR